jgi:hypothetical protein
MSFKILTNKLYNIFLKILFKIGLLKDGYFIDNNYNPLTLRIGSAKSIWLMTANFLIKFSCVPKVIRKRDYLNYSPKDIQKIWNRINPRCWDIIEHSNYQKALSERKNFYFPVIDINDYEISHTQFNKLFFYEHGSGVIVEVDGNDTGGFGHLLIEIFPILVYLSLKLPLTISTTEFKSKNIFKSFAKAYSIKMIDSVDLLEGVRVNSDKIIYKYGLKVAPERSKYEYPNYNNTCLMLDHLSKLPSKQDNYSKYIYVGRKEATSSGRILDNENELVEQITSLGFKKIYPEDYSFEEQISIFYNARIVVGASGSALLNCIFCKKTSHVIELCPDLDFRPGPWLISQIMSKNLYHFFSGPSYGNVVQWRPEKFKIDTSLVIKRIKDIINLKNLNEE